MPTCLSTRALRTTLAAASEPGALALLPLAGLAAWVGRRRTGR